MLTFLTFVVCFFKMGFGLRGWVSRGWMFGMARHEKMAKKGTTKSATEFLRHT